MTTSKYFTPLGKVINGNGVTPDIIVEEGVIKVDQDKDKKNSTPDEIMEEIKEKEEENIEKPVDYKTDNQLMHAVDALKTLKFLATTKTNK